MSNYALRAPESLFAFARKVAEEEHVSMNQFFVAALKIEAYFRERHARGDQTGFNAWLVASPGDTRDAGDKTQGSLDHI